MRGVTSSSVAISDWRQPARSSAAARRQWTVTVDVHMVAWSPQADIHRCTVCFKIPRNSLSSSRVCRALFSHSHLAAGWGGVSRSLTWFLYSQRSLHTVSRLFSSNPGWIKGCSLSSTHNAPLTHLYWAPTAGRLHHFGSAEKRRERSCFFRFNPRTY